MIDSTDLGCDRCGQQNVELFPSPSKAYFAVCKPCGDGDNQGLVTR